MLSATSTIDAPCAASQRRVGDNTARGGRDASRNRGLLFRQKHSRVKATEDFRGASFHNTAAAGFGDMRSAAVLLSAKLELRSEIRGMLSCWLRAKVKFALAGRL
jgi:hypothetical protein